MNIILFTQQLAAFRSGVGTYAMELLSGLIDRSHRLTVVVPRGEEMEINGVDVITVPRRQFDPTPGGWVTLCQQFAKVFSKLTFHHDIAHFADAREAYKISFSKIPIVGMVNDSYALEWRSDTYPRHLYSDRFSRTLYYAFIRRTERKTYPRFTSLICNSAHVAGAITSGYLLDASRIHVIHYGLKEQPPVEPIFLEGHPSILLVGGNFNRKGLSQLMDAVSQLKDSYPDIRIHVVGRDRNQPSFEKRARKLEIRESVVFHGWKPNDKVRGMMAGTDIFALPSLTEAFGLVYLEAMRAGAPVIATSIGGAKEVFRQGQEAIFINPGDVNALAAAIEKITSDPETADRLRKGGRMAATRFTVDAMIQETEALFLNVAKKKR